MQERQQAGTGGRRTIEDLLAGVCGFITCLATAVLLAWIERQFGFALYTWMFWLIVPVGAGFAGFAGASGYYFGSILFGHRPTKLLLLNIALASLATFFLIHYLEYSTLLIDGKPVSDYVPFTRYLDFAIRSTSMQFRFRTAPMGTTGELGALGYGVAALQIAGFAVGGMLVWVYLSSLPFCEQCSKYLSRKGTSERYTGTPGLLQENAEVVVGHLKANDLQAAVKAQQSFGGPDTGKEMFLRSVVVVRFCKKCGKHWLQYKVEKRSGQDWKEIPELTTAGFTDQQLTV